MKKSLILLVMALFITGMTKAQRDKYWVGISLYQLNFETEKYFTGNYQNQAIPRVYAGIPISERFKIMPSLNLGKATDKLGADKTTYWKVDAATTFSLLTHKIVEPYLLAGVGVNQIDDRTHGLITAGLGVHVWITDWIGINAQTNWDAMLHQRPYWQNSVGLVFGISKKKNDNNGSGNKKDIDGDGVPNAQDLCPELAGTSATQGCPDADGDGVKDADDACPNEAGTLANKGCPDSDGDGIPNAQDKCPNAAGLAQFNGCPDSDGDGIPDKDDKCPNEKGINGCPDADNDGVNDKDDQCPHQPGTAALKGCPDKDGDGVADKDDQCPDKAGIAANHGCPVIEKEEAKAIEQKLNISAKKIQFETGSAKIKPASYGEMDQVIAVMKQYPFTKFDIEGYSDNVGNPESNKTLSRQRAEAVYEYFESKGIAGDRLFATGYGQERPIATNNTAEGRAQNRRVEIHLKQ